MRRPKRSPVRVCFIMASRRVGGTENSMARLIAAAHPQQLDCSVILTRGPNPELAARLESAPAPVALRCARTPAQLLNAVREARPDVVYMFGHLRTIGWALVCRVAKVPLLVGAERSTGMRPADRASRWIDRWLLDAYIANSAAGARGVSSAIGRARRPVIVCPNGIDLDSPQGLRGKAVSDLSPSGVVCVGTIRPLKGQMVLLEAIAELQLDFPGLQAILVGHDATGGRFFKEALKRGLERTHSWVGYRRDVREILKSAQVVVLPSLHREGMPTSILEAMAEGIPVVASDIGGVRELLTDGTTGILVPPGNSQTLAGALRRLLCDRPLRKKLGKAGREQAIRRFSAQAMVECHVRAFGSLLEPCG